MRIVAVRMRETGHFRDGVALEGLSGGLDVLAGPNELGKSTIFRALEAVFLRRHSTTGKVLDPVRPRAGGDPLIEADFEVAGTLWRIRKRFGRGATAQLTDLGSGRLVASRMDAEERLSALLGLGDGVEGRLGLLWVGQGRSLVPADPDLDPSDPAKVKDRGERSALIAAIEREVEVAAGGAAARAIRAAVEAELYAQVTESRSKPRAGSPYQRAIKARDELGEALRAATARAAEDARARDELASLADRHRHLADPARLEALRRNAERAEAAFEAGRRAADALDKARSDLEARRLAAREQQRALQGHDRAVEALALLVAGSADEAVALEAVVALSARLDSEITALAAEQARLLADERALAEREAAFVRGQVRAAALARIGEMTARLRAGQEIEAALAERTQALAANRATDGLLARAEGEARAIESLEARLAAAAARIRITYEPGSRTRLRLDGQEIGAGAEILADRERVLEIPGIGRVTIAPGAGEDRAADTADLAAHRLQLQVLLSKLGATDLAGARAQAAARRQTEADRDRLTASLADRAPRGLPALAAEIEALHRQIPVSEASAMPAEQAEDTDANRARIDEVRRREAEVSEQLAAVRKALAGAAERRQRLALEAEHRRRRTAEIEAGLPAPAVRDAERRRLADAAEAAGLAEQEALRALAAAEAGAPDAAALRGLEADRSRAAAAMREAQDQVHNLERRMSELEGQLQAGDQEGIGPRAQALSGELERLTAEVRAIEHEIEALSLLRSALADSEAQMRARYLEPVSRRLDAYLAEVFPGAHLHLGDGFTLAGLTREGGAEDLDILSEGTREQLAILVRLGFGRLLADTGHPTPLILDDALVYSDDRRIARMFAALTAATAHHQVLVLTCRERSFEALGGRRLALVPWTSELA